MVPQPSSTVSELQASVDGILARLALPAISDIQITEIVDARLAEQRKEFQAALQELHNLCQMGFVNMQASFDGVDTWRREVTETFTHIQSWATEVEQRIITSETPSSQSRPILGDPRPSLLSSTPFAQRPGLPCQTPALQPVAGPSAIKRVRLSDASDYSLQTIPEQILTPTGEVAEEEAMHGTESTDMESTEIGLAQAENDGARPPFEAAQALHQILETPQPDLYQPETVDTSVSEEQSPAIGLAPSRTPAASKTLYGTERSTDERFDDVLAPDGMSTHGLSACQMSGWTSHSPSWFKKVS